jgi:hypothetical protein
MHTNTAQKNVRIIELQQSFRVQSLHIHGRIIIATLVHHDVGPSPIHAYTCVSGWSNTYGAASAHPSDSVAA